MDLVVRCDDRDIGVVDGVIAAVEPELDGPVLDARGQLVLPGGVDVHVHFNEPGRTDWEGWATGSAALAAGGVTTALEMPLNAHPPTVDVAAFALKRAAAERSSLVDFGLWGGVVPGNVDELEPLADAGVCAFKAFMSDSGTDDFGRADDATLLDAMVVIARLGMLLGVHAENDTLTRTLAARAVAAGRVGVRDYLASRPAVAEAEAIARVLELARATGCRLHVVHVSTGRGAALVAQARADGIDVTCEVTPHHLLLNEEDAERLGVVAKCAPPLRPASEPAALRAALDRGDVSFVASDHSPSPPGFKEGDAFAAWGGIAGCQHTLELLLTAGLDPAGVFARAPAQRFGLAGKGRLEVGADADLVLVDPGDEREITEDELRYRHRLSPYVGRRVRGRVTTTLLRGRPVGGTRRGRMVQIESR